MDASAEMLEQVFARWAMRVRAPGVAWGLIRDGGLAASGGIGTLRAGEDATPGADSVFRIASMTKSFSGAAVMSLVAEGRVRLDEPVATYVPALASWRGPTADGPPITVRHLVSMEAGLPTDDPWADRHLDLSQEGMEALIAAGAAFTFTPGIAFEYSNLGWGLIAQVVRAVTGEDIQTRISRDLLGPLGMTRTTWVRPAHDDVAEPYEWCDEAWELQEPTPGDGTIAPMGGLWTTVTDLARWVSFFLDAWPPRDDPDDGPVPRWARREMQQLRRIDELARIRPRPDGPSRLAALGYGIGLGIRVDDRLGYEVGHSGGLPGYGSHMRWLPDRGIGVVAVSNVTYGNMHAACIETIERLADLDALPAARGVVAAPAMLAAADRAVALANGWRDDEANALFADNVVMDESFDRRRAEAASAVERHGRLILERVEPDVPQRGDVVAAGGAVKIELELNHEARVQWMSVNDRAKPSDAPILADPARLAEIPRSAYVLLRPTGDLADAFDTWRGEVLDRLGGAACVLAAPHASLKAFGSTAAPLSDGDEERIAAVVRDWAAATAPIELRADGVELWSGDEEAVPVLTLATEGALRTALVDLWERCLAAELPAGYSDHIGAEQWRAHLSLCYPVEQPPPAIWEPLGAWARHADIGGATSTAFEAELVVFGGGAERRLGRFPLRP